MIKVDDVHGRPNDVRGFIHRKILGLGGQIASTLGNLPGVSLLPGSGIVRTAGDIATRLSGRSGGRSFGRGRGVQTISEQPVIIDLPKGAPQRKNDFFGVTVPDPTAPVSSQQANGVCAPAVGNRRVNAAGQCAPPGFHWNVSSYFRKGGACSRFEAGFVEAGTVLVKNRKMNNANGGAQNLALKRIERGQDHAKRILRATGWRTISKQSSREMRMRRRGHR